MSFGVQARLYRISTPELGRDRSASITKIESVLRRK